MKPCARVGKRFPQPALLAFLLLAVLTGCFGSSGSPPTPVTTGSLAVSSEPPEAEIFLNGEPTGAKTPAELKGLQPGFYELTLKLGGTERSMQVIVEKGKTNILPPIDFNSEVVEGRVVFGRGGSPVPGSIIEAILVGSAEPVARTGSRPDGTFTLHLPPGRYNIMARQENTWAVGVAQDVDVPGGGLVEIVQQELFADEATANPQILSIQVEGLRSGDHITTDTDIRVRVLPESALVRFIGVRIGHQHAQSTDVYKAGAQTLTFTLKPDDYAPGSTYLHVAAYDVQLNSAQLKIPFFIAKASDKPDTELPAPTGVALSSYTFLTGSRIYSTGQMEALADALAQYGISRDEWGPEAIPPYHRWVRVYWYPVEDGDGNKAAGYRVYRRVGGSGEKALVADWPAWQVEKRKDPEGPASYIDGSAALRSGVCYYYSVQPYDATGRLGKASAEVPIVLLEPFEARLVEPAKGATVSLPEPEPVVLRWHGTPLPEPPACTGSTYPNGYEYVYRVAVDSELPRSGLGRPDDHDEIVRGRNEVEVFGLVPGRHYQWDLTVAYATAEVSGASRAFAISGRHNVGGRDPWPGPPGLDDPDDPGLEDWEPFASGGSVNGAFWFKYQPLR